MSWKLGAGAAGKPSPHEGETDFHRPYSLPEVDSIVKYKRESRHVP